MPNKNKTKGSNFERNIAKYLTELYGESFVRVPNSGAYTGGTNTTRKNLLTDEQVRMFKGDIIPPESFANLVIECKSYKAFPFHKFITREPIKLLDEWIDQVKHDCDKGNIWLLFFKINNLGTYVVHELLSSTWHETIYQNKYHIQEMSKFFDIWKGPLKQWSKPI